MTGKDCVAIASDLRFGVQNQTNAVDMKKIFKIHDHLYCGLAGLATDMQTLAARFAFRHKLYKLREERNMSPVTFAHFVSTLLYEKRFGPYYCEPVIAGLQPDGTPYVTGMDLIGAMAPAEDFVVSGNNTDALLGVCESMYKPGLAPEDLFEVRTRVTASSLLPLRAHAPPASPPCRSSASACRLPLGATASAAGVAWCT